MNVNSGSRSVLAQSLFLVYENASALEVLFSHRDVDNRQCFGESKISQDASIPWRYAS